MIQLRVYELAVELYSDCKAVRLPVADLEKAVMSPYKTKIENLAAGIYKLSR